MADDRQQLVVKAIGDIADGRAAAGQSLSSGAAAEQRRAQELRPELGRPQLRPGLLSEAQSTAEEFFRAVGRLGPEEKLTDDLSVRVKLTDGRDTLVPARRLQTVRQLRERIGSRGGLTLSGRPVQEDALLYDLWLRDGLGCAGGRAPWLQVVVQNVGG